MAKHFEIKNKKTFNIRTRQGENDGPFVDETEVTTRSVDRTNNLETIIKRVEPRHSYDPRTESVITLNEKTGEQVSSRPLISLGRKFVDFRVSTIQNVSLPDFLCSWSDSATGNKLETTTRVTIEALPEREYRLVQFLYKANNYSEKIISSVKNWFQQYAIENPRLASHFFDEEEALTAKLVQEARRFGLKLTIGFTPVQKPIDEDFKEFKLVKHTIRCNIRDNWDVRVTSTLAMNLIDARRFKWSNVDELQSWATRKLEQVVQNHLIEAHYVDLLLDFTSFERSIRDEMETEARNIGYEIRQLLSIPELEEIKLLDGFEFNTIKDSQGKTTQPAQYVTKDPRIKININVEVSGKLESLSGPEIKRYLKPGISIVDEMRKAVISTVRTFLHGINPERFYMHYSSSYDSNKSFEEELTDLVQKKLTEQFGVVQESLSVSILQENTDLSTRFQKLQERPFALTFSTFSESVKFTVKLRVDRVHETGWFRFKANNYSNPQEELGDISEVLKDNIETYLNTALELDFEILQSPEFVTHIRKTVEQAAKTIIADFGLVVKFVSMKQHASGGTIGTMKALETKEQINVQRQNAILKLQADKHEDNLNRLKQLRLELARATADDDDDLEKELQSKINDVEKELLGEFSSEKLDQKKQENRNRKFDGGIEGGATFFLESGDEE